MTNINLIVILMQIIDSQIHRSTFGLITASIPAMISMYLSKIEGEFSYMVMINGLLTGVFIIIGQQIALHFRPIITKRIKLLTAKITTFLTDLRK
jgi:hypothetical protein